MKAIKTVGLTLLVVGIGIIGFLAIISNIIKDPSADVNSVNAKKVRLGMDTSKVMKIMGRPRNENILRFSYLRYQYDPPGASSYGIFFEFDSLGVLKRIEREDSSFFATDFRETKDLNGLRVLDTIVSKRAGMKFKHE